MKRKLLSLLAAVVLFTGLLPAATALAVPEPTWNIPEVITDDMNDQNGSLDIAGVDYVVDETYMYVKIISNTSFDPNGLVLWTILDIDENPGSGDSRTGDPSLLTGGEYRIEMAIMSSSPPFTADLQKYNGSDYIPTGITAEALLTDSNYSIYYAIPLSAFDADIPEVFNGVYLKQGVFDPFNMSDPIVDTAEGSTGGGGGGGGGEPAWPGTPTIDDPDNDSLGIPEITGLDCIVDDTYAYIRLRAASAFDFTDQQILVAVDIDSNPATGSTSGTFGPNGTEYLINTDHDAGFYLGSDLFRYDSPTVPMSDTGMGFAVPSPTTYFYYMIPLATFGGDAAQILDGDVTIEAVILGSTMPPLIDQVNGRTAAPPAGPSAMLTPSSGPAGTITAATGANWPAYESFGLISVGGFLAAHDLSTDTAGNLLGTVTIPEGLGAGSYDLVTNGLASGLQTFTNAFTVVEAPAANLVVNGNFELGTANWWIVPQLPSDWSFVTSGRADVHPPVSEYYGAVYYQNMNVTGIADVTAHISLDITNVSAYTSGNTVAIYLVYLDNAGNLQKVKIINPANIDLTEATPVSADYTFPSDAVKIVRIAVSKEDYADFTIDNIVLTAPGATANPIPVIANVSPAIGDYGTSVTITGSGFGSVEGEVSIGGTAAGITVNTWTDTSIGITVDEPARSGPVIVTAGYVDSNPNFFFEVTSPYFTLDATTDYLTVVEGQTAMLVLGIKFHNGWVPADGLTLQMASGDGWGSEVFSPAVHYTSGGAVLKIDTAGITPGIYPLTIEGIDLIDMPRTATFTLEVVSTDDIVFTSLGGDEITSLTVNKQQALNISVNGYDANLKMVPVDLVSDNPLVVGVYATGDMWSPYAIYSLTPGTANIVATAPDGYTESLPVTVGAFTGPVITSIGLSPFQTTNLYQDNISFSVTGSQALSGGFVSGLSWDNLANSTLDFNFDNTSYGGTFDLNPGNPPGVGTFMFGGTIDDGTAVEVAAAVPLTVINDPSLSAMKGGVFVLDGAVNPFQVENFDLEFYNATTGILEFTRNIFIFQHPGMGEPEFYVEAVPAGTYKIQFVPADNMVQSQWWPNQTSIDDADAVEFVAGQTTGGIYFFALGLDGPIPVLESINVLPDTPNLNIGTGMNFIAMGTFDDSSTKDITAQVAWDSSDTGVATITTGGYAVGVAGGSTIITASLNGIDGTETLVVNALPTLVSIDVLPDSPTLNVGDPIPFAAIGTYSDSSTMNITTQVTWDSSDTGVATITAIGMAMAVGGGTTTITASLDGIDGTEILTVNAPPTLVSIDVLPDNPNMNVGDDLNFTAMAHYSDSSTLDVTGEVAWDSSDTGVATITTAGNAVAVAAGTTTITASLDGIDGTETLVVNTPVTLVSIDVLPDNPNLNVGDDLNFTAFALYSDSSTLDVTGEVAWDSSDTGVASITTAGNAVAVAGGTTTITASLDGIDGTEILTVNTPPQLDVITSAATTITETAAVLNGSLVSLDAVSVDVSFEWGTASGVYGTETSAISKTQPGPYSIDLTGLTPGTTYYFRAIARGTGIEYGDEFSFTTLDEEQPAPGDANGDSVISVLDMTKVARIILSLDPPTPGADANLDQAINVLDMTKIARLILGFDQQ